MRRKLAALLALLSLIAAPASGHQKTALDPDDSPGPLDIAAARHRHRTSVTFEVVTYETWSYEAIDGGKQFVAFEIDRDRDGRTDRCVVVTSQTPTDGAALGYQADVYKGCTYFDDPLVRSFGTERVERADEHSIAVTLPRRAVLGRGVESYAWRAATSFEEQREGSACPAPEPHGDGRYGSCADFSRWKGHRFGTPSAADTQTVLDADDTPGPLDVVAARVSRFFVAQSHPERHWEMLGFRVVTYETWSDDLLAGIDNHISFEFDLDGDGNVDRCLEVRRGENDELRAQFYTAGCDFLPGDPTGTPRMVARPDAHSLQVDIRRRLLGKAVESFRWRAVTSYDESGDADCPRPDPLPPERRYATCTDFTEWRRHRL